MAKQSAADKIAAALKDAEEFDGVAEATHGETQQQRDEAKRAKRTRDRGRRRADKPAK